MVRDRTKWSWFVDERPAWIATGVWLSIVVSALVAYGADYAPGAKLDIHGWSEVATIVSGVLSPVAVLWVVRSFYVQKKELASAVEAASQQSEEFALQNQLSRSQFHPWLNVELGTWGTSQGGKVEADDRVQKGVTVLEFTVANAGPGIAHNVDLEVLGLRDGKAIWLLNALVAYSMGADDKRTIHKWRAFYNDADNPEDVVFAVTCVDILRGVHRFAFNRARAGHSMDMDYAEFSELKAELGLGDLVLAAVTRTRPALTE